MTMNIRDQVNELGRFLRTMRDVRDGETGLADRLKAALVVALEAVRSLEALLGHVVVLDEAEARALYRAVGSRVGMDAHLKTAVRKCEELALGLGDAKAGKHGR